MLQARRGHSVQTPTTGVKQSKPKNWKAVKDTSQIRKSLGSSTVKVQPDTNSHESTIPHLVEKVQSSQGSKDYFSSGQGKKI